MERKRPFLKIILLGDSGVGKSALISQFIKKQFSHSYKATLGADFYTKEIIVNGETINLQVWDTAGQERYKSLGISFYRGADCVLLVYDVTSPSSYHSIELWKEEFLAISDPKDPKRFPFVVVGNKIDLRKNASCPQKIQDFMACDYEVPCFEVSALDGTGVEQAFQTVAKMAMEKEFEEKFFDIIPAVTCHNINKQSKCLC